MASRNIVGLGVGMLLGYAVNQFTAVTLHSKRDPALEAQRSSGDRWFQWVFPSWHMAWEFVKGPEHSWSEKAAAIILPNQYTAYAFAKQSNGYVSGLEGTVVGVTSLASIASTFTKIPGGSLIASIMAAYQANRSDVHFPLSKSFYGFNKQNTWIPPSAAAALPSVWRQNLTVPPVVLRQTKVWTYRPTSPVFTKLTPLNSSHPYGYLNEINV